MWHFWAETALELPHLSCGKPRVCPLRYRQGPSFETTHFIYLFIFFYKCFEFLMQVHDLPGWLGTHMHWSWAPPPFPAVFHACLNIIFIIIMQICLKVQLVIMCIFVKSRDNTRPGKDIQFSWTDNVWQHLTTRRLGCSHEITCQWLI